MMLFNISFRITGSNLYPSQGDRHPGDHTSRADRLLNKDLFEIINEGLYRFEEVFIVFYEALHLVDYLSWR